MTFHEIFGIIRSHFVDIFFGIVFMATFSGAIYIFRAGRRFGLHLGLIRLVMAGRGTEPRLLHIVT